MSAGPNCAISTAARIGLAAGHDEAPAPDQGHDGRAELAERCGRDIGLLVPEGVDDADQRRPLAREILQAEQLDAGEILGPQRALDILLVQLRLQAAAGHHEIPGEAQHALRGKVVADPDEVPRLDHAAILLDLIEVGKTHHCPISCVTSGMSAASR